MSGKPQASRSAVVPERRPADATAGRGASAGGRPQCRTRRAQSARGIHSATCGSRRAARRSSLASLTTPTRSRRGVPLTGRWRTARVKARRVGSAPGAARARAAARERERRRRDHARSAAAARERRDRSASAARRATHILRAAPRTRFRLCPGSRRAGVGRRGGLGRGAGLRARAERLLWRRRVSPRLAPGTVADRARARAHGAAAAERDRAPRDGFRRPRSIPPRLRRIPTAPAWTLRPAWMRTTASRRPPTADQLGSRLASDPSDTSGGARRRLAQLPPSARQRTVTTLRARQAESPGAEQQSLRALRAIPAAREAPRASPQGGAPRRQGAPPGEAPTPTESRDAQSARRRAGPAILAAGCRPPSRSAAPPGVASTQPSIIPRLPPNVSRAAPPARTPRPGTAERACANAGSRGAAGPSAAGDATRRDAPAATGTAPDAVHGSPHGGAPGGGAPSAA